MQPLGIVVNTDEHRWERSSLGNEVFGISFVHCRASAIISPFALRHQVQHIVIFFGSYSHEPFRQALGILLMNWTSSIDSSYHVNSIPTTCSKEEVLQMKTILAIFLRLKVWYKELTLFV
jgi:hypothetical protein